MKDATLIYRGRLHRSTRGGLGSQTVIAIAVAAQPDEAPTTNAVRIAMVITLPPCVGQFGNDLLRGSFPDVLQAALAASRLRGLSSATAEPERFGRSLFGHQLVRRTNRSSCLDVSSQTWPRR